MDEVPARRAEWEQRHRQAAQVAAELTGLDVEAARALVERSAGVSIRFAAEGEPVTADFRYGRITAVIRDGVVIQALAG